MHENGQRRFWLGGLCVALFALGTAIEAAELPPGFRLEPVVSGLTNPSALAVAGGQILIAERTTGQLRVVRGGELQLAPLCTVAVNATGEAGLLGVAAHPAFDSNGWIYLYFTDLATGKNKVRRFTVVAGACGAGTDILADLGAGASFLRNGGGLSFGADGKLYVATGDMQVAGNGQNAAVLAGKVLRVNDDGSVPSDNPTPGNPVYAVGVRDGRALAVRPGGQLYLTDRGEVADLSHDELNAVAANGNLGWSVESGPGTSFASPLASWATSIGVHGLGLYATGAFPALASNGRDDDEDSYGPNRWPGKSRIDDNAAGECVGSTNNGLPCTSSANCPPRPGEPAYCEMRDEAAEYCPGGVPVHDDDCDALGPAGIDEPDESYVNNLFAASSSKIQRAVTTAANPAALSTWRTFLDSAALADCPTGWTGLAAAPDGLLYALATNGGGAAGALYRIAHEGAPGPREVSPPGSPFALRVERGASSNEVEIYWEDLRKDAMQPRNSGATPQAPEREYTVWKGSVGSYYSHSAVAGLGATPGISVNGALRKATVPVNSAANEYFLVSGRGDNLEGTLGAGTTLPRPGYPVNDLCQTIGYHQSPSWTQWSCGRNFSGVTNERNQVRALSEMRGQVMVMDFGAIWCAPCHSEANVLENLHQLYRDREVKFLTVMMDEESNGTNWSGRPRPAECRNWGDRPPGFADHTFECVADPKSCADPNGSCSNAAAGQQVWPLFNAHGALPTTVVLDSGGRVAYTIAGWGGTNPSVEDLIRQQLDALVGAADTCLH